MLKKLIFASVIMLLTAGCSSGRTPVSPDSSLSANSTTSLVDARTPDTGGRYLWGYWEWNINTADETIECLPMRTAEMHLNASQFVDGPPVNISLSGFSIDGNVISLSVGLTHPFPGKPNLAGFDVHGILIGAGTVDGWDDSSIVVAGPDDAHLVKPDGWSRWWNPVEFNIGFDIFSYRDGDLGIKHEIGNYNCTLNAFKLFADDLESTEDPDGLSLVDRAAFTTGSTNIRHYDIYFPKPGGTFDIKYNYAVDASWEPIPGYEPGEPVNVQEDFPAEANQPEPFRMDVEVVQNTLYFDESIPQKGGAALLHVKVFDWQGYLGPGDVADQVNAVSIDCPACLTDIPTGTVIDVGSGGQAYAEYEMFILGKDLTGPGNYTALLTVVSADGDYQPILTGYSGAAPLSSYLLFPFPNIATVAPQQNDPPTAVADVDKIIKEVGETFFFDGSDSFDLDGFITTWEWDFDGDGTYGDPFDAGTSETPELAYSESGTYFVDLMVTDDDGDFDTLDAPIEITVESLNQPPVAVAEASATEIYPGEVVDFDGTGSFDTDGTVVEWEWDFDGDGVFGDAYYSGTDQEPSFKFDTLGQYDVDLKVTDDDDATDTLDAVITIYVVSPDNIAPVALAEVVGDNFWADQPVEFDATSSYDPDGTVVEWKWDFNNDGIFGDPFDAGTPENPQKAFAEGDHTINLRVIDNGGKSDVLDEPLEISVHPHVIITLPEDQYYKSANGYEYVVMSCVVPELIPVDYMGTNGPWDFTGHDYEADPDYLIILPPDDPEVAGYIPGTFPASTQYFLRYDATVNNIDAYMYLAEEADLDNDLLFIYGHVLKNESHPDGEEASYLPEYGGPMALQYPCSLATDELEEVNFKAEDLPFIMIRYHEVGFGEGWCTVPFDSGWTTPALLTRTLYEIEISGAPIAKGLLYKWTADDGRQLARLYAVNTTEYENFDLATFEITGQSVLTVLNDQF